jgi:redox-sensitive bicupin YhaK (pirin superfamily)
MNRIKFIKGTIASGLAFFAAPFINTAASQDVESTYDRLRENIGFNHVPNNEIKTMNTVLHKANTRGSADHGWLKANHTFSFANYHNPERMHFGVLRVLNDDSIAGGKGFNTHPHDNMEIITIPLQGDLEHKDNMGNGTIIKSGDVQVMSAGTGITHSEFNASPEFDVKLLQIWLFPNKKNVTPRYDQLPIMNLEVQNDFYQILSPNEADQGVWIHQNAWFSLGEFREQKTTEYKLNANNNGVYAFIIEGEATIEGQKLEKRDGFGIWDTSSISITAETNSRILLMEVPMSI